jgi:hypothetical protein
VSLSIEGSFCSKPIVTERVIAEQYSRCVHFDFRVVEKGGTDGGSD